MRTQEGNASRHDYDWMGYRDNDSMREHTMRYADDTGSIHIKQLDDFKVRGEAVKVNEEKITQADLHSKGRVVSFEILGLSKPKAPMKEPVVSRTQNVWLEANRSTATFIAPNGKCRSCVDGMAFTESRIADLIIII